MGLEVSTYISGLTNTWPVSGDPKSQGDDHLRLIKSALQNTFPNASRALYFPNAEVASGTMVLDATDYNNFIGIDTTAGDVSVTLPSTLTTTDKGWFCEIYRSNIGTFNGIMVAAASGNINSVVGATATIRIERPFEPCKFVWTGTLWAAWKPGMPIGATMLWDANTTPAGFRVLDGSTLNATTFAELNLVMGTTVLRDKRGRVEIGVDGGGVNMTSSGFGGTPSLGATKAGSTMTLATTHLPPYTPSGSVSGSVAVLPAAVQDNASGTITPQGGGSTNVPIAHVGSTSATWSGSFSGTAQGGVSTAFSIVPPTIVVNKHIRVC